MLSYSFRFRHYSILFWSNYRISVDGAVIVPLDVCCLRHAKCERGVKMLDTSMRVCVCVCECTVVACWGALFQSFYMSACVCVCVILRLSMCERFPSIQWKPSDSCGEDKLSWQQLEKRMIKNHFRNKKKTFATMLFFFLLLRYQVDSLSIFDSMYKIYRENFSFKSFTKCVVIIFYFVE